jgi:hypothetical protein
MPTLDNLPGDQRAVLQLVLSRGRSYEQIAKLLSISPDSVRGRAHAGVDALGPQSAVSAEQRGLITDYLLGQLADEGQAEDVRELLAHLPAERAWARVVASELAPLSNEPLPEIPSEASGPATPAPPAPEPRAPREEEPAFDQAPTFEPTPTFDRERPAERRPEPKPDLVTAAPELESSDAATTAEAVRERSRSRDRREREDDYGDGKRRSSRLGGIIVILLAVVVVLVVVFFIVRPGKSSPPPRSAASSSTTTPAASAGSSTTTTSSSSTAAKVIAQINLTAPKSTSKAVGIAEVLNEGTSDGVAIVAQNIPPNTTKPPNAYAVWLYNSPTDSKILGFVDPGVGSSGRFSTASGLPTNASHYKQLIVTLETTAQPKTPGQIVLQGTLTGL